jgi:hypothetical protein
MNKRLLLIVALVAGIAIVGAFTLKRGAPALHVNQVGADPLAYKGIITVTGVMAGTSLHDPRILGMFDIKELQCNTPNCKKLYLPVRHQGLMPKPGDELLVTGSFVSLGGGFLFDATEVKIVRSHKLGG